MSRMPPERRGRGRGRGGHQSYRDQRPVAERDAQRQDGKTRTAWSGKAMGYKKLQDLIREHDKAKDSNELLMRISTDNSGFSELLHSTNLFPGQTRSALRILAIVCQLDTMQQKLLRLLNEVADSPFISASASFYFTEGSSEDTERPFVRQAFEDGVTIAARMFSAFETKAVRCLSLMIMSWNTHLPPSLIASDLQGRMGAVEQQINQLKDKYKHVPPEFREKEMEKDAALSLPPNDYRNLSICPTYQDLTVNDKETYFLRQNKIAGPYDNGRHYLDVQFRLIKEDFLRPLRDGITQYLSARRQGSPKSLRNIDVRLYYDVKLISPEMTAFSGIVDVIQFKSSQLKNVNWEASNRLMFGSLVCLTHNNFESISVAVVVDRKVSDIKSGKLKIKLLSRGFDRLENSRSYLMAESKSHFETCKQILQGLQGMNPDKIPMADHIVRVYTRVPRPAYLTEGKCWDFTPLIVDPNAVEEFRSVPVLKTGLYPGHEDLGMDPAQRKAFVLSLVRRMAIVQGPPGTGKTFLGYKVMQILLHNKHLWNREGRPIMVICFTNHALDQFLEGILHTGATNNLVRIGGQSKCEGLKQKNIAALRQAAREHHSIPAHIYQDRRSQMNSLKTMRLATEKYTKTLVQLTETLISENNLQPHMLPDHFRQLNNHRERLLRDKSVTLPKSDGDPTFLYRWLALDSSQDDSDVDSKMVDDMDFNESEDDDEDLVQDQINHLLVEGFEEFEREGEWQKVKRKDDETRDYGLWLRKQPEGAAFAKLLESETENLDDVMTEHEELQIVNVMALRLKSKWKLYRTWLRRLKAEFLAKIDEQRDRFDAAFRELQEVNDQLDLDLLKSAEVIGLTTTGAARCQKLLEQIRPPIVIVEEAAEIMEAQITAAMPTSTEHLILIGDHKQLRPNVTVHDLAVKYHLDISLFERMIENRVDFACLEKQHRMRPRIRQLLTPHIYESLKDSQPVKAYPKTRGMETDVFFFNHQFHETSESDTMSKKNPFESKFVSRLAFYLLQQGQYNCTQITVLTTYLGQLRQIKRDMGSNDVTRGVRCTVVDNFQGEENEIIILSLVRSNDNDKVGFLKTNNRICVALSRAKKGFYVVGNMDVLEKQKGSVWPNIIQDLRNDGLIGDSLTLCCANHETKTVVQNIDDFKNVPEGGCMEPCNTRLNCGHSCKKICHPDDPDHTAVECRSRCERMCTRGLHGCNSLCGKSCPPCNVSIEMYNPACGHRNKLPCHLDVSKHPCPSPCTKLLSCGHVCGLRCGNVCNPNSCNATVQMRGICGHDVIVECKYKNLTDKILKACRQPCTSKLECGHPCTGSCSDCYQGRFHQQCSQPCEKLNVCGHPCKEPCSMNCPPCERMCENRCGHSKCRNKCGVPCVPCLEKCSWKCKHKQCTKLCSEDCDRTPCNMRCTIPLRCGHRCAGLCGEPCPRLCRICDKEELEEIFFGTEDEADALFVQLTDCGHVFERTGLDQWMEEGESSIGMKACPKCKTGIHQSLRYNNSINRSLRGVMAVKQRIFGTDTTALKNELRRMLDDVMAKRTTSKLYDHMFEKLGKFVAGGQKKSARACETIRHQITILGRVVQVENLIHELRPAGRTSEMTEFHALVVKWMNGLTENATKQQLTDIEFEVIRMELMIKLDKGETKFAAFTSPDYPQIRRLLYKISRFIEADIRAVEAFLKKLGEISQETKLMIINALGAKRGSWFQCPNGHIYHIGDCGGATMEGTCNECFARIGGARHTLRADNTIATAMDGATAAAWPTALRR